MPRRPGRPADEQHRRIALMLRTLTEHAGEGRTARQLMAAMRLDPDSASDERKFRRDLKAMRVAGWQIDSVRRGLEDRYVLRVVDHRIRTTFTDEQRAHLLRAAERARLGQLYEDFDPARSDGAPAFGPEGLGVAQHAIRHGCRLRFTYSGRPRVLHPDDVSFSGANWYVRGYEEGTKEYFKTFRLDRAVDMTADPPGTAQPARDLEPLNRDPTRWDTGVAVTGVVETTEVDLQDVISKLGVNGHRMLAAGASADDRVTVEVDVTNPEAFVVRLFELGTRVRLIGPDPVRRYARDMLAAVAGDRG